MKPDGNPRRSRDERRERIEKAVADFVERMNRSGELDPIEVIEACPDISAEVLREIDTFRSLELDPSRPEVVPLGSLGDFTLRRQIGRGGMGVVYDAWQTSVDRRVALKVLPAGVTADERAIQRFVSEARTAAKLSHPNVVGVYGLGVEQHVPYYAMEYGVRFEGFCKPISSAELAISLRTPRGSTASANSLGSARLPKRMADYGSEYGVYLTRFSPTETWRTGGSTASTADLLLTNALSSDSRRRSTGDIEEW